MNLTTWLDRMMWMVAVLAVLCLWVGILRAETVTWSCNTEADMKAYRGERKEANSRQWGVLFTVPHEAGCKDLKWTNTKQPPLGPKEYRLFAIDTAGNASDASATVQVTLTPTPIGGVALPPEDPLPNSPVPTPPEPRPADMPPVTVRDVTETTAILEWVPPPGANVSARIYSPPPMRWGTAVDVACAASPCKLAGLDPGKQHVVQAIPYFGELNKSAIFGKFTQPTFFTTKAVLPPCADGKDNDGDGKIDYPADPGCEHHQDGDEHDPPPPPPLMACQDKLDNDGDGKIDFPADPGCQSALDTDETDPPTPDPGLEELRESLKGLAGDLAVLQGQFAALQNDVPALRTELQTVKAKLDAIRVAACAFKKSNSTFAGKVQAALGGCP